MCSDTTLYRTFTKTLTPGAVDQAREAVAGVRSGVWRRTAAINGDGEVILDVDATPVEIHSESKQGAHCDGGYGFHLLFCFADATGDALSGMLRPGNAAVDTLRICWLSSMTPSPNSLQTWQPVTSPATTEIRREAPTCSPKDSGHATERMGA